MDGDIISTIVHPKGSIVAPNMTYNTRAVKTESEFIANGSVAILKLNDENKNINLKKEDLNYFSTKEFR
jgi:hypothetical protein